MMTRILLPLLVACLSWLGAIAQSYDERIGDAMNRSDWFALDTIYASAPKDSLHPFLEVYSRCLIGNRLNRPEVSILAFQELLTKQSTNLDLGMLVSSTYMYGIDLSRVGQNEAAAAVTNGVLESAKQYLDEETIQNLTYQANRYQALSQYAPYQISFPEGEVGAIPFALVQAGPKEKEGVLMRIGDSRINGQPAEMTFDTGAGVNVISPELAEKYGLIPLEGAVVKVEGMAKRDGYTAIAKELKLGNLTVTDVPFTVVSVQTGHEEADQYMGFVDIVIGSELMLQLKDVTLDFSTNRILVSPSAPVKTDAKPNLCFSSWMGIRCDGVVHGERMLMNVDSGDSSYGSLGDEFFEQNKDYVLEHGTKDVVRSAGVAGVTIMDAYRVPDMEMTLGGHTVKVPAMIVRPAPGNGAFSDIGCNVGLKTLMLYRSVRFNLVDFVLTTEP